MRSMVEGAWAVTKILWHQKHVDASAPPTAQERGPPPRYRGAG